MKRVPQRECEREARLHMVAGQRAVELRRRIRLPYSCLHRNLPPQSATGVCSNRLLDVPSTGPAALSRLSGERPDEAFPSFRAQGQSRDRSRWAGRAAEQSAEAVGQLAT